MVIIAYLLFYPTLGWNVLLHRVMGRGSWWNWIDDHVLLGALPFACDAKKLHEMGIGAVVNTCREYAGPKEQYAAWNIEQLRIPTTDFIPPALEDLEKSVAFIQQKIAEGKKIYVHCKAGRGRSATVAACYLINKGMSPEDAQKLLTEKRPVVISWVCRRKVVQEFAKSVR